MKGAHAFPYPKMREVLTEQPGWYYARHRCEALLSSEILADKRTRSRRAVWDTESTRPILYEGHEIEYYWYLGPYLPDRPVEEQRAFYYDQAFKPPPY